MHEADVHALVDRLEQASESRRAVVHHSAQGFFGGTGDVGVLVRYCGVHFRSIAARMLIASAPELKSCIDSRATSTQMAQLNPCVIPAGDVAVAIARADEAVLVVAVAVGLAAAVARHVAGDLGMPRGKLVDGARDAQRTRQRVAGRVEGRQRRLTWPPPAGRGRPAAPRARPQTRPREPAPVRQFAGAYAWPIL